MYDLTWLVFDVLKEMSCSQEPPCLRAPPPTVPLSHLGPILQSAVACYSFFFSENCCLLRHWRTEGWKTDIKQEKFQLWKPLNKTLLCTITGKRWRFRLKLITLNYTSVIQYISLYRHTSYVVEIFYVWQLFQTKQMIKVTYWSVIYFSELFAFLPQFWTWGWSHSLQVDVSRIKTAKIQL